jgi:uncharacterized protein YndB with AHSA1/START domain
MPQEATRPPLLFQATIALPREAVFQTFFGEPTRWLCREGFFEPRVEGRVRLCWPDGCIEGRLAQYEPPRIGRFSWRFEGDPLPETMVVVGLRRLERDGQPATRAELEHYGFGVGPAWDMLYVGAARAWAGYLKTLRALLEAGLDLREEDE